MNIELIFIFLVIIVFLTILIMLGYVKEIGLYFNGIKITITLRNKIKDIQTRHPKIVSNLERTTYDAKPIKVGSTPRHIVLEAWNHLHAALAKCNASYGEKAPTVIDIQQSVNFIHANNLISTDQVNIIVDLYHLGKEINDNPRWAPIKNKYTLRYQLLTEYLVFCLDKQLEKLKRQSADSPPRKTTVDSFYNTPATSHISPVAVLIGKKGQVQGKKFNVDKELFYLGASSENDVVLNNDDYVSGNHALLQTHAGKLLLLDQHSRNGTFLNGKRLADKALPVNIGDKIKIGNSTFKVTAK